MHWMHLNDYFFSKLPNEFGGFSTQEIDDQGFSYYIRRTNLPLCFKKGKKNVEAMELPSKTDLCISLPAAYLAITNA
ncbi:MAG: hypothetical protein JWP81_154 [Ferruginibacter sp.]|nr:hypothetical protein [Ferruginibacter sp.]